MPKGGIPFYHKAKRPVQFRTNLDGVLRDFERVRSAYRTGQETEQQALIDMLFLWARAERLKREEIRSFSASNGREQTAEELDSAQ